jgi:YbbR domain-containing protein
VKKLFLENLATKVMAVFLAVLTWVYLFTQGNGERQIQVEFQPPSLDRQVFASLVYRDTHGKVLEPGGPLEVRLSGPRGDVNMLSLRPPLTFSCKFPVDAKMLGAAQGSVPINLEHAYFGIPSQIQVQPLPSNQITVEYVKYLDKEVDLETPLWEGEPREGYKVDSIGVLPTRIRAKVPADVTLKPEEKIPVRRVPVAGRFETFTLERWELEPGSRIIAQTPFRAEVKVVGVPATRRLQLDLHLMTKEENKAKITLMEKTVTAEIQGPQALIAQAPESAFVAYILVPDADVATPGPKNINSENLGCHIDPRYRDRVTVILKPEVTPENRQVKITVK